MDARKIIIAAGAALASVASGTAASASVMPARSTMAQAVIRTGNGTGNNTTSAADFYGNAAQVLAIVLLALVWDTTYFDREHMEFFRGRLTWTPGLVRLVSLLVTVAAISSLVLCLVVLSGWASDKTVWRVLIGIGLGVVLFALLWRMISHMWGRDDPSSETRKQAQRKEQRKKVRKRKAERKGKVVLDPPPTILGTLLSMNERLSKLVAQPGAEESGQADKD